ncbi:endonuclease/exonuclease/phosphatase family protein [Janibacter corallicola]|uniref:endonuclease/exonuclease/phosphatase family protein n=1 Tax=Janibacter corallicola TaxID=415212 RepID=UPI0008354E67|nr:endonuclease/exonuclease/phosphatase family protein [Janibacter corallicola]
MVQTITVASWNIRGALTRTISESRVQRLVSALTDNGVRPDVLLLQEVPRASAGPGLLRGELAQLGLGYGLIGEPDRARSDHLPKAYVNLTVSRWPLDPWTWRDPSPAPWPELLLATQVRAPSLRFLVVNAHIPNGSNHGWWKIDTFHSLARALSASDLPTVLGGDFNEPKFHTPQLISWGVGRNGSFSGQRARPKGDRGPRPRQEWQDAVTAVLQPHGGTWRGKHAALQGPSSQGMQTTHVSHGAHRSYDHILTNPTLLPATLEYIDSVREGNGAVSDHSLIVATIHPTAAHDRLRRLEP